MKSRLFSFDNIINVFFRKNYPVLILFLILLFNQCTIEKRLYNKGYYFERKHSVLQSSATEKNEQSIPDRNTIEKQKEALNLSTDEKINTPELVQDFEETNFSPKDTVYIIDSTSSSGWTKERKKNTLLEVGTATLASGLVAGILLSDATAAGASLSSIIFLGFVGWLLAIVAAILLLLFIIFLCIPPKDKSNKTSIAGLSNGESVGLLVLLSVFGIIGLIFLMTNK